MSDLQIEFKHTRDVVIPAPLNHIEVVYDNLHRAVINFDSHAENLPEFLAKDTERRAGEKQLNQGFAAIAPYLPGNFIASEVIFPASSCAHDAVFNVDHIYQIDETRDNRGAITTTSTTDFITLDFSALVNTLKERGFSVLTYKQDGLRALVPNSRLDGLHWDDFEQNRSDFPMQHFVAGASKGPVDGTTKG